MLNRGIKKVGRLLSREQTEILETALLLMLPALLTKLSGLFFNLIAASYFGTKELGWNQFLVASSIPELLTNVFLIGTLGSIVIPTLITVKKREGNIEFRKVYSSIINLSILIFSIVAIILAVTADTTLPFLLNLFEPDTVINIADYEIIISMMRVLLIPQVVLGFSVFISSGLNVHNRYLVPQLAPLFYNIGRVVMLFILVPLMNYSPWAIVVGVFVGSFLHLFVQIPLVIKLKLGYVPVIAILNKYVLEILRTGLPRIFAIASEHIAFTFNKFLAYGISGNIAALTYANSLSLVIPTLFGYTFSVPSYTILAELYEENDNKRAEDVIIKTLNEILFLSLPFIIILIVLRVPIVRLVFGIIPNTRFGFDDTSLTAWILLWFTLGHVFICGRWFIYRVFYAAKDTMYPFLVSLVSLVFTIILSIAFTNLFSYNNTLAISDIQLSLEHLLNRNPNPTSSASIGGIALAMSITYSLEFFILLIIYHYTKYKFNFKKLIKSTLPKFYSGAIMFVILYFLYKTWNSIANALPVSGDGGVFGSTTLNLLILTIVSVITALLSYYLLSLLFRVEELKILKRYLNPILKLGGLRIN